MTAITNIPSTRIPITDASLMMNPAWYRFFAQFHNSFLGFSTGNDSIPATLTLTEIAAASVTIPSAGKQTLFIDTADHKFKRKDSSGAVTTIA